jgi:phage tail sheath protein FI
VARAPRLPGISFEAAPPPPVVVLPRMDVAGFAGITSSGPVDVPVAVEDALEYESVFGPDAPLAWDAERGEEVTGAVGPAVRSFFRNGGRRCYVVRVADGHALTTALELPGFVAVGRAGDREHALLRARSPGSWADGLRVAAALTAAGVRIDPGSVSTAGLTAYVPDPSALGAGDVLRLRSSDGRWALVLAVASVTANGDSVAHAGSGRLHAVEVAVRDAIWLTPAQPPAGAAGASYIGRRGTREQAQAEVIEATPAGAVALALDVDPADAPTEGALVALALPGQEIWLQARTVLPASRGGSAHPERAEVRGPATVVAAGAAPTTPAPSLMPLAERLAVELLVDAGGDLHRLGELGLARGHPRFLGALPTDEALYLAPEGPVPPPALWSAAAQPRFPLAGPEAAPCTYLPIAAGPIPTAWLPARPPEAPTRVRDGLAHFDASLFLDDELAELHTTVLLEHADFVRYRSPQPRRLRGAHALLGIDEVTLVAAPDATQRPWWPLRSEPVAPTLASPPAGWAPPAGTRLDRARFLDCALRELPAPEHFTAVAAPTGAVSLSWDEVDGAAEYELQESPGQDFAGAQTVYRGPSATHDVYGRAQGAVRWYRVRALAPGAEGDFAVASVVVGATERWLLAPASDYVDETLLAVHGALLRMCAARGDLFALLALPEHYREDAAIAHARALRAQAGADEALPQQRPLGYGAIHHPWLVAPVGDRAGAFRRMPPDGAAAGVLAARAELRGAWIAPANEPLRDVVALAPAIGREAHQPLQDAQVNLVRHEPDGFLWLSADTLSTDEEVRPINVRRLLQLVRRAALLQGPTYVFEPNDATLRRTVERGFEALLTRLFLAGAFAGATPDQSFRVSAGSPPNSPQSIDQGRLVIELRLAPSRPLAFLTIRLVRSGETLVVEA